MHPSSPPCGHENRAGRNWGERGACGGVERCYSSWSAVCEHGDYACPLRLTSRATTLESCNAIHSVTALRSCAGCVPGTRFAADRPR